LPISFNRSSAAMIAVRHSLILFTALLGGCATGDSLEGQRTVFSNPYVAPVLDQRSIGPQCEVDFGRDATCLGGAVNYSRRGRTAVLEGGETLRLTRAQRRLVRERADLIEARRNDPPPPPASPPQPLPEPVLPTAQPASEQP
jgi:hypothetical protein